MGGFFEEESVIVELFSSMVAFDSSVVDDSVVVDGIVFTGCPVDFVSSRI